MYLWLHIYIFIKSVKKNEISNRNTLKIEINLMTLCLNDILVILYNLNPLNVKKKLRITFINLL